MKAHFVKLFGYDRFENESILKVIIEAEQTSYAAQATKIMAHTLAAQQVWLNRCLGLPLTNVVLWPDWPANDLAAVIDTNSNAWLAYLNGLSPEDFDREIAYHDTKGNPHQNKLIDILTHVINHGTHHRAQAGQQLKHTDGIQLPVTDYIFYIRQL